jgi:hypothetical protein
MAQQDKSEEKIQHSDGGMQNSPSPAANIPQASVSTAKTTPQEET